MKTWTFDEHPTIDGPWVDEPDKALWVDPDTDLDCMIKVYWIGFDCAHGWDLQPLLQRDYPEIVGKMLGEGMGGPTYKDFEYLRREVTDLARQAHEARSN
jgi:hypothetical protein